MKRVITALALCLLVANLPAFATAPPVDEEPVKISTKAVDKTSFRLWISNLRQATATVQIESLDGTVTYFYEYVKDHNGYAKLINLRKLPEGKYLLKVVHQNEEMVKVIRKDDERLFISKTSR